MLPTSLAGDAARSSHSRRWPFGRRGGGRRLPARGGGFKSALRGIIDWLRGALEHDAAFRWTGWLLIRLIGFCFLWAFLALVFQMEGLIGPQGLLPADDYLTIMAQHFGIWQRWMLVPSLLWFGAGTTAIHWVAWGGLIASLLVIANVWPRAMLGVCLVCFLSFLATAQDFASYQSDGMIMAAGLIGMFVAPPLRLRWSFRPLPSGPRWIGLFGLRWLWFTIYFDSGLVKIASHDPEWRHLTAMDHYYEYGPLPTWIGWYAQKLPQWFQTGTALLTLIVELGVVWMSFMGRRGRLIVFWIVTPLQIGIILTANYGFLNYLVLFLGFTLVDDRHWQWWAQKLGRRRAVPARTDMAVETTAVQPAAPEAAPSAAEANPSAPDAAPLVAPAAAPAARWRPGAIFAGAVIFCWIFITGCETGSLMFPELPWPRITALEPFRIADSYGLFASMTTVRDEIEFEGSDDGVHWVAYPFRYKPQDPNKAPGIYAPYQPRFDWNLWFASLGTWRQNEFVLNTEVRLMQGSRPVLALFAGDPFAGHPPRYMRAVIWQYNFSTRAEKRSQGVWWTRRYLGLYAPSLARDENGQIVVTQFPPSIRIGGGL